MSINPLFGQALEEVQATIGPSNGTIIILCGGKLSESLINSFVQIGGGLDVPMVIIPAADGQDKYDDNFGEAAILKKSGATNVKVFHTKDRNITNTESFVKPLINEKGILFSGGRQWRLVDAYENTLTEKMLWRVLGMVV